MKVIGIDIGGTNIRIGTINSDINLTDYKKIEQSSVLKDNSIIGIANFVNNYINEYNLSGEISAMAIGIPAAINKDRTVVLNAPNVHGLDGINIKSELGKYFSFPIYLEKDVSMLFYRDMYHFKIDSTETIIACYIGTGIGNVISIDGKLLTGHNGVAGELGHIPVWNFDDLCNCGNYGCMESLVGGKYLAALHKNMFPDTDISRIFTDHSDNKLIQDYIKNLALPIATEINIIDPSTVIIGGGVISMKGFPLDIFENHIRLMSRKPLPEKNLNFIYSIDDGRNGVTGAGIYAMERNKVNVCE